jgi:3-oxoacyl-[acyl-carrier protein] reductase
VAVHYNASRSGAEEVSRAVASAGGEAIVIPGDLSRAAGAVSVVAKAAERFGQIDGLINNAGSMSDANR